MQRLCRLHRRPRLRPMLDDYVMAARLQHAKNGVVECINVDGARLWRVEIVVVLRDAKRVDLFRRAAAFSAIPVSSTALCRYRANCSTSGRPASMRSIFVSSAGIVANTRPWSPGSDPNKRVKYPRYGRKIDRPDAMKRSTSATRSRPSRARSRRGRVLSVSAASICASVERAMVERNTAQTAAMQSVSISKRPGHAGTFTKIRAGGRGPKNCA